MKYPLFAIPFTTVLSLAACGGSSTGGDTAPTAPTVTPAPTPAPTVTVTAPSTGVVSFPFTASWVSTNATSCATTISHGTGATGTVSVTEATAGTKIYSVTCTGAGGTATGSATTVISALPTAEGLWQGATGDSRTLRGIVAQADNSNISNYWLVYSKTNNAAAPAGFVAGTGTSTALNAGSGTFASSDLREFNFDAHRLTASGNLTAPYAKKTSLGDAGTPPSGSYQSTVILTSAVFPQTYTVSSTSVSPAIYNGQDSNGNPVSFNLGISGTGTGTATLSGTGVLSMTLNGSQTLDISAVLGLPAGSAKSDTITSSVIVFNTTGTYHLNKTGSTTTVTACANGPLDAVGSCNSVALNTPTAIFGAPSYYSAQSFTLSGGTITVKSSTAGATVTQAYTLTNNTASPAVLTTFAMSYLPAYETTPALSSVVGNFTGSAGIDVNMQTAAIFNVASDGSITGTESVSHCNYAATMAASATGNSYDVTALTFTNAGGTCAYTAEGTFAGAATYDATSKQLSVTAVNTSRTKGFLFVGTKP